MMTKVGKPVSGNRGAVLPLNDFRDFGLLQEANRLFFHPRGLSLMIIAPHMNEDGKFVDPILRVEAFVEGVAFEDSVMEYDQSIIAKMLLEAYSDERIQEFGSEVQPLPPCKTFEMATIPGE